MKNSIDNPYNAMIIGINPRIVVNVLIMKKYKQIRRTHIRRVWNQYGLIEKHQFVFSSSVISCNKEVA